MIEFKNINKSYKLGKNNVVTALKDINIDIKEGSLVVLKGASGSGKSSILSLVSAISKPTSGEVIVDNKQISKLTDRFASEYRLNNIGIVFQKYNLVEDISVEQNVILPLIPKNMNSDLVENKVDAALEMFDIKHYKHTTVKNLSGGEQQRVAIARAYINSPKIIIADEPTANLDEKLSLNFINIIKDLKEKNKTIIIATHDPLFFDLDIVDKYIEMKNGSIV
ncbi:ABC transporter ATP-binding protein [Sulfurimonas lithotrophica]|uniref:Cell division ATP-binding protein FtsE n=1 Tax=Sulfurimonas lithotrophica TaxID=2590022 RepID=A0A5P8P1K2_9BACT|nr:ABC transporter ATP-binding protein [Sulfurimonas lithotrophica]QFR49510.1 ABC transporter ATP-binding protein [Sulfurimonas lithotrophica]